MQDDGRPVGFFGFINITDRKGFMRWRHVKTGPAQDWNCHDRCLVRDMLDYSIQLGGLCVHDSLAPSLRQQVDNRLRRELW